MCVTPHTFVHSQVSVGTFVQTTNLDLYVTRGVAQPPEYPDEGPLGWLQRLEAKARAGQRRGLKFCRDTVGDSAAWQVAQYL